MDVKTYKLGTDVQFLSYTSEEEWHNLRKDGIGGSDIGAILGLNEYSSPLKVWRTKKGICSEDFSDNVYVKKGKDLESLIFEKYVKTDSDLLHYDVLHPEHVFVNKQFPWLRANCDGLAVAAVSGLEYSHIVIEIKWVSEWAEVNWDGDTYCGIPASYYAQVQHYMTVTGAKIAYLYAMFDRDWTIKRYVIPYDFSFCVNMLSKSKDFHESLLKGIEPRLTATLDKAFMPKALTEMPAKTEVSEELDADIAAYLSLKDEIKRLEIEMDSHYNNAVAKYLEGKRPTNIFKMNVSTCKKTGFDTKAFAAEHSDVYEQYKTVTEYTRTTIKRS